MKKKIVSKKSGKKKKNRMSVGKMVAIGAGAAALGAGAYYLLGPKGKAHRKKTKALAVKMAKAGKEMEKEWESLNNRVRPAPVQAKKAIKKRE
ncbi:MAG: hypothetical protein A2946_01935 [Candidatus Liptonbacteria bacterium RIFCSPLOWO2_01_FULL_53_13]|uniref:Uncharacterized protein n=1 Tax=Candidatus Liptonbacteria bacterium RIFCSPLOWO2_01_FULL_53_13 TaxID=1798651 RepID=A0A1G2CH15_9BACT|nr:MAG: hypothetical protein A2946_01935 [Candidatus Liptonbacteria bacterium RIFCSPLOWO2_01_FULL_53_13]